MHNKSVQLLNKAHARDFEQQGFGLQICLSTHLADIQVESKQMERARICSCKPGLLNYLICQFMKPTYQLIMLIWKAC